MSVLLAACQSFPCLVVFSANAAHPAAEKRLCSVPTDVAEMKVTLSSWDLGTTSILITVDFTLCAHFSFLLQLFLLISAELK